MKLAATALLLCPPKTASRTLDQVVLSEPVPAPLADLHPDTLRHLPLFRVPSELRKGRVPYVVTRDPKRWYESWWAHMRRQPNFDWNHLWPDHHGNSALPFRQALYDYTVGALERDPAGGEGHPFQHLAEQRRLGVGWWGYQMLLASSDREQVRRNPRVRWLRQDDPGLPLLQQVERAGFTLSGERVHVGVGDYERPAWDDEMLGWVRQVDGPVLDWMTFADGVERPVL